MSTMRGLFLGVKVELDADPRAIAGGELVTVAYPGTTWLMDARVSRLFTGEDGNWWAWLEPAARPDPDVCLHVRAAAQ